MHGTIASEVLAHRPPPEALAERQVRFDAFRTAYNPERPHAALPEHRPPGSRFTPSPRSFPDALTPVCSGPDDQVQKVRGQGSIGFQNRIHFVGRGPTGESVAIRPTETDGVFAVVYRHQRVTAIDRTVPDEA